MKDAQQNSSQTILNDADFFARLNRVFTLNKLDRFLNKERSEQLLAIAKRLVETNARYNLTAITDMEGIILKHFADCAALIPLIPKDASLLDVGTGAGFPSLPLAVFRPDIQVTALDATEKKVRYVADTASSIGLTNLTAITSRAEDYISKETRGTFSVVTARAVSELRILSELCLPFCRKGGLFLAMKGKNAENELKAARKAIPLLGGRLVSSEQDTLTNGTEEISRFTVVIQKVTDTPAAYPRPYAKILKSPL